MTWVNKTLVSEAANKVVKVRASSPLLWPGALGPPHMARLVGGQRTHRGRHGAPGLRPPAHAVRRARLAGDVLHDRDGHSPTSATGTGWERTEFAREGRKPLARLSTKSLVRARDAECICSHIYAGHRQERSEIATVCERCSCVGFAPRDQRAWNRLASSKW